MGSMYAQIRDEVKAEAEGLRRKCPSCGRLMNKLPTGKWHCLKCSLTFESLKRSESDAGTVI